MGQVSKLSPQLGELGERGNVGRVNVDGRRREEREGSKRGVAVGIL
jgi:hypothetical protein